MRRQHHLPHRNGFRHQCDERRIGFPDRGPGLVLARDHQPDVMSLSYLSHIGGQCDLPRMIGRNHQSAGDEQIALDDVDVEPVGVQLNAFNPGRPGEVSRFPAAAMRLALAATWSIRCGSMAATSRAIWSRSHSSAPSFRSTIASMSWALTDHAGSASDASRVT